MLERADDKHIRVVPTFAQGRVREDEAHRLVKREQSLLILQDQVIGIHVVRNPCVLAARGDSRIHLTLAFLVDGKIAAVCFIGRNAFQVLDVRRLNQTL